MSVKLAEKSLMADALKKSEDFQIEQTMLDDKLKATDWEATNEEIMELVAQESYLQWLKDNEKRSTTTGDSTAGGSHDREDKSTEAVATCSSWSHAPPQPGSSSSCYSKQSPSIAAREADESGGATAASTSMGVGGAIAAVDLDDDNDILAQVLAASQQEYLDSLKAKRHQNRSS